MRDLIIAGCGIHAAEMAHIVDRLNAARPTWNLLGHLAAPGQPGTGTFFDRPVLGSSTDVELFPAALLVPCYSWPRGAGIETERLATLIDPSCCVHPSAVIGKGTVLFPGCYVGANARVGDWVFALSNSLINHDDVVGDRVTFASGAVLAGQVTVEPDVYLGQGCMVRQDLRIGVNAMVGMGAVVIRDVAPGDVVAGNPARRIKSRGDPA